jgi:hypothetical protein
MEKGRRDLNGGKQREGKRILKRISDHEWGGKNVYEPMRKIFF